MGVYDDREVEGVVEHGVLGLDVDGREHVALGGVGPRTNDRVDSSRARAISDCFGLKTHFGGRTRRPARFCAR